MVALFSLVSCSNQNEISLESPIEKKSNFETFAIYGEAHNALLHHVSANFIEPQITPTSKEEAVDYVLANAAGTLSNNEFEMKVNDFIESSSLDFKDAPKGALGGVVLNVSKSSLDYWEDEQLLVPSKALPVFVGADIAGSIIGACVSSVGSYVTAGDFNWKSVAWSAASSAIVGSTGIVGKVGKWISKLF